MRGERLTVMNARFRVQASPRTISVTSATLCGEDPLLICEGNVPQAVDLKVLLLRHVIAVHSGAWNARGRDAGTLPPMVRSTSGRARLRAGLSARRGMRYCLGQSRFCEAHQEACALDPRRFYAELAEALELL